ncbi:Fis family transcriptional regulator [Aliivibrio kagoshimensis]|uniref:Fis family transcriptional regulator n=1 Tax=Aliivibrio kagoshimensis TaxID=2910230 RepID=UPI003D111775
MRKSDKKKDNQLRVALTEVCDSAEKEYQGFQWLTHRVNYDDFPKSLRIVCVFASNKELESFKSSNYFDDLNARIQQKLLGLAINLKRVNDHILYDTEEACCKGHNGKWANRLSH